MKLKSILASTALATVVAIGLGPALAQAPNPSSPGSARGGVMAQPTQPGGMPGMTQQGATSGATTSQGAASGGGSGQQSAMSEQQIRTALEARGYSNFSGMERDGDSFRISGAERYGKKVEDLRVDARTGQVRDEARLTEDQVRNMLSNRGFSDVSDVNRDGDTIRAKAKRDDREVTLRVDARTGVVSQQQSSN
jgi:hypothetical protein